jgi:hypothetical protein
MTKPSPAAVRIWRRECWWPFVTGSTTSVDVDGNPVLPRPHDADPLVVYVYVPGTGGWIESAVTWDALGLVGLVELVDPVVPPRRVVDVVLREVDVRTPDDPATPPP